MENLNDEQIKRINFIMNLIDNEAVTIIVNKELIEKYDSNGNKPLYNTIQNKNFELTNILLMHNADPNTINQNGDTALHLATLNNYKDVVNLLLKYKADPNIKNNYGQTSLHVAIINNNKEIIQALINKDADPNIVDINNRSCLHYLVDYYDTNIENQINIIEVTYSLLSKCSDDNISSIKDSNLSKKIVNEYKEIIMERKELIDIFSNKKMQISNM